MTRIQMTRRTALAGGLALPALAAAASGLGAGSAVAAEAEAPPAIPPYRRMGLGEITVTSLLAGTRAMENPHSIFGTDASAEDFEALSTEAFLPTDRSLNFFTPVLIETGDEKILFDTGLSPDGITAALAAAGHAPGDITKVVITHMHGDHIGGLMGDAGPTFANAAFVTGQTEFDHWAQAENQTFEAKVRPLADRFSFLKGGDAAASGITAIDAPGHTPGHMAYMIESAGKQLVLSADAANHYVWSLRRPDWQVKYDTDKAQAAATRKSLFGMVAAERIPFIGYHMPFPGAGYLETRGEGFHFVPTGYQLQV